MAEIKDNYKNNGISVFTGFEEQSVREAPSYLTTFENFTFRNKLREDLPLSWRNVLYAPIREWNIAGQIPNYTEDGEILRAINKGYLPVDFTFTGKGSTATVWDEGFYIESPGNKAILIHSGTNPKGKQENFIFKIERTDDYIFEGASNTGKGTYHTYKDISDPGIHQGAIIKKTFSKLGYIPKAITLILGAGGGGGYHFYDAFSTTYGGGGGASGASIGVILRFLNNNVSYTITTGYYGYGGDLYSTTTAYPGGNSKIECYNETTLEGSIRIPGGQSGNLNKGGSGPSWTPTPITDYVYLLDYWNCRNGGDGSLEDTSGAGDGAGFSDIPSFGQIYDQTTAIDSKPLGGTGNSGGGGGASAAWKGGTGGNQNITPVNGKYGSGGGAGGRTGKTSSTTGGRGWFILVY